MSERYLAIEIGGTKLQLAVGRAGTRELDQVVRSSVVPADGAQGIISQIGAALPDLLQRYSLRGVGVGFGGPVRTDTGTVTTSHQIEGWDDYPLGNWLHEQTGLPVRVDNDCNVAALAEASMGAGAGAGRVFYVTVGTGVGGGFVIDGRLDGSNRPAIAEIGHLRPGLEAASRDSTVESIASGWGIARNVQNLLRIGSVISVAEQSTGAAEQLLSLCGGEIEALTTKQIGEAANAGNPIAQAAIQRATGTLGWALAQMTTLLAPDAIVIGGGVSLIGAAFFAPLADATQRYVFPPLAGSYQLLPAALGEEVVLYGAIQLASQP